MSRKQPIPPALNLTQFRSRLADPQFRDAAVQARHVWCELQFVHESRVYVVTDVRMDDGRCVIDIADAQI
jgi:hypothetical protein